jgi:hypothetical protein
LLTKRTYFIPALIALVAFPAAALATSGGESAFVRPIDVLQTRAPTKAGADATSAVFGRSTRRFHRTISITVARLEAAREARARRERRRLYATLPGGVSMSTLESIAACESGGDPAAVSSDGTYRGKYQFDYGTWESVGGSGDPAAAPESEQDYRAALLYSESGSSPWPICG